MTFFSGEALRPKKVNVMLIWNYVIAFSLKKKEQNIFYFPISIDEVALKKTDNFNCYRKKYISCLILILELVIQIFKSIVEFKILDSKFHVKIQQEYEKKRWGLYVNEAATQQTLLVNLIREKHPIQARTENIPRAIKTYLTK